MRWLASFAHWFRFDIVRESRAREYVLSRTVKTESLDLRTQNGSLIRRMLRVNSLRER